MREVFGEHGFHFNNRRASHKTDRSRGYCKAAKPRQNHCEQRTRLNQRVSPPRGQGWGYPDGSNSLLKWVRIWLTREHHSCKTGISFCPPTKKRAAVPFTDLLLSGTALQKKCLTGRKSVQKQGECGLDMYGSRVFPRSTSSGFSKR